MNKGIKVFAFMACIDEVSMVVTDKSLIKNSRPNQFQEVTLIAPETEILKWAEEIKSRKYNNEED